MAVSPSDNIAVEIKSWSDLPLDLIPQILSHLTLSVYPIFACVCKLWNSFVPQIYPVNHSPLLMHYNKRHNHVGYYSPSLNKTFVVNCCWNPSGGYLYFLYAKIGWLILCRGGSDFLIVNPITGKTKEFQMDDGVGNSFTFSSSPSSPTCTIFSISSCRSGRFVHICFLDVEDYTNATTYTFENNLPFEMSRYSNPVFLRDCFYCLGKEGNLGVFDDHTLTWTILAKPKRPDISYDQNYLVESNGELLSVFISELNTLCYVFRLNQVDMIWERISNLGDNALFVGWQTSIATSTRETKLKNKVFMSMIHGEPECVEADVKICDDQIFFVRKAAACLKPGEKETDMRNNGIVWHYDLEKGEQSNYGKLVEYATSIWFEPSSDDFLY